MNAPFGPPRTQFDERIIQNEVKRQSNLTSAFVFVGMGIVALLVGLCALHVLAWLLFPGVVLLSLGVLAWLGNLARPRRW